MPPRAPLFTAASAATVLLAACAGLTTTSRSGSVGDTLSVGGLHVTVSRVDRKVPRHRGTDYSGLGTPSAGARFVGVRVRVCNDRDQAIGPYDFALKLDGGDKARLRFPQTAYGDGFESQRSGCGSGWIVFEAPTRSRPDTVTFKYDDTGSSRPGQNHTEKHARFRWDASPG